MKNVLNTLLGTQFDRYMHLYLNIRPSLPDLIRMLWNGL